MSQLDAYQGKNRVLKIGRTAGALVTVSGPGGGFAGFDRSSNAAARMVPGGGDDTFYQPPAKIPKSVNLNIDANSRTWPILWGWDGQRLYVEDNPLGEAAGTPKDTFQVVLGPVNLPGPVDGELVFAITGNVSGAITTTTNT